VIYFFLNRYNFSHGLMAVITGESTFVMKCQLIALLESESVET